MVSKANFQNSQEHILPSLISANIKFGNHDKLWHSSLSHHPQLFYVLSGSQTKNTCPAKKLRSIKRLFTYNQNKSPVGITDVRKSKSLSISPQNSLSFSTPKPKHVTFLVSTLDIPPSFPKQPKCYIMFLKHHSELELKEVLNFNCYRNSKLVRGEPLEWE